MLDRRRRDRLTVAFDLGKPSGLTRTGPPKRKTELRSRSKPLAARSTKKAAEDRLRSKVVHDHFGDRDDVVLCQMGDVWERAKDLDGLAPHEIRFLAAHECWRKAWDAHERLTRGRGGSTVDVENITVGCRPCHDLCDSLPALALRVGLLHSSKPGT